MVDIRDLELLKKVFNIIRNPYSVRPFQHVLEPVMAYLLVAKIEYTKRELAGSYNIVPDEEDYITTGQLADMFCEKWHKKTGKRVRGVNRFEGGPHEENFLKLDCSKIKKYFLGGEKNQFGQLKKG